MDLSRWTKKATRDNRGRPPETLSWRPEAGIELPPLIVKRPAHAQVSGHADWLLVSSYASADTASMATEVEQGIDILRIDEQVISTADAAKSVQLAATPRRWAIGNGTVGSAAVWIAAHQGRGLPLEALATDFGLDPLAFLGRTGTLVGGLEANLEGAAELARWADGNAPRCRTFTVTDTGWHAAGADEALASALAVADTIELTRAMESHGLAPSRALRQISHRVAVSSRFLMAAAKLRALRRIHHRIADVVGTDSPLRTTAVPAWRERTRVADWANILRNSASCFGAIVGGAECIDLPPHRADDPEARRLARNTHLILRGESHLGRTADPGAGSYALETLTDQLAHRIWSTFQDIERMGGLSSALRSGWVSEQITTRRLERETRVRTRRRVLLGLNRFPDLSEAIVQPSAIADPPTHFGQPLQAVSEFAQLLPLAVREPSDSLERALIGRGITHAPPATPSRLGDVFEAFRTRPGAPSIHMATLGPLAEHTARTRFGIELLATGGLPALESDEDDLVTGWRTSGCFCAVLSASPARLEAEGADALRRLTAAGAKVWVLGAPGDLETELREAGAVGFLYQGIDAVEALKQLWECR